MRELGPGLPAVIDALTRANIGIVVLAERDGTFEKLYANEPAVHQLGYAGDEWLAIPMFAMIAPEHRARVRAMTERLVGEETMPPAIEVTFLHREGHEVRVELSAGRANLGDRRALVLIVRAAGIHPQHLSLLEADRIALVGALAAGFAHETNNPLTSVLLNARSLRKQLIANLDAGALVNALRCLDDITTGSERIAGNVRALQTLATRSSAQTVDLVTIVSAALRLAAPTLEPHANLVRQFSPVRAVAGEEARIGQAVLAMMLFSSSGFGSDLTSVNNRITVAVEERDGSVVVEVSDNGRDLGPEEIIRAFDPFYRSSARGAGVGVGLGVARSVAATLGGEVTLAPRPGGGAVITMRLPPVP